MLASSLAALAVATSLPQNPTLLGAPQAEHRLRADFAPSESVLAVFTWSWPGSMAPLLRSLAAHTRVRLLVEEGNSIPRVRRWIAGLGHTTADRIEVLPFLVDSPWVRDYGPLQVVDRDGAVTWLDSSYPERPIDDAVPQTLSALWGTPAIPVTWSLDGGALASRGDGLCVSTWDYFVEHGLPLRASKAAEQMMEQIGCRSLMLLRALPDEPTHHVDLFVQFLSPHQVAVARTDADLWPEAAAILDDAADALADRRWGLEVVRVPITFELDGQVNSHVNGLRLPDAFLMPIYLRKPSPAALEAERILGEAMPGVQIVRVPAAQMGELGGGLHCATLGLAEGTSGPPPEGTSLTRR